MLSQEFRCGENVQFSNDRQTLYRDYLHGCGRLYGEESCQEYETERLEMGRRQPLSMVVRVQRCFVLVFLCIGFNGILGK